MTYKSVRVRVATLVAYYKCGGANDQAVAKLASYLTPEEFADIAAPRQFIYDVHRKFEEHRTVENLFSGRISSVPVKVPDSIIRRCGDRIKAGYWVQLQHGGRGRPVQVTQVHRYYTSIKQACQKDDFVGGVLSDWNVSIDHLRTRMHEVCPEIVQTCAQLSSSTP